MKKSATVLLCAGFLVSAYVLVRYFYFGFNISLLFFWISGPLLVLIGLLIHKKREVVNHGFDRTDILLLLLLFLFFAPLYLAYLYEIPIQVNTDEVTIMYTMREFSGVANPDWFGLSHYFNFPSFIFLLWGKLAEFLGGITLYNTRLLHAMSGITIILASYVFFRLIFEKRLPSILGAVILGVNHSLFAISRMAMRDNLVLLVMLFSFTALYYSLKHKSLFAAYLGGALASFGWYQYFPARIVLPLWAFFFAIIFIFFRERFPWRGLLMHSALVTLGFLAIAGPVLIATINDPELGGKYAKEQLLIFPEGREFERNWIHAPTVREALVTNAKNTFVAFNEPLTDSGWMYANPGHGFLDPITGVLLWLGLLLVYLRYPRSPPHLFLSIGFLFLLFFSAFLLTKNPQYTRYLIFLPFVSGLSGLILSAIYKNLLRHMFGGGVLLLALLASIFFWNGLIYSDYIVRAIEKGNDVGGTARYVEARRADPNYKFYLAASKEYPYYDWGEPYYWKDWLGFFTKKGESVKVVEPKKVRILQLEPPFSVFVSFYAYTTNLKNFHMLQAQYPDYILNPITPDGRLIAFEVK